MAYASNSSAGYLSQINALKKPTYKSQFGSTISGLMDQITNKAPFSYDFNADPLYQNYKDQYSKMGNEAAMNAAAAVSAQTGGFGNSYAASAASQANQQYLTQLNNYIPELYNAAMQKYQMETQNLYDQFGMYQSEENRLYGEYKDKLSDYYSEYNNLINGYNSALSAEQAAAALAAKNAAGGSSSASPTKSANNNLSYATVLNNAVSAQKNGNNAASVILAAEKKGSITPAQAETIAKKVDNVIKSANKNSSRNQAK